MDYLKYFKNNKYEMNTNDCWTFVQQVFYDEHKIKLPDHPIMTSTERIAGELVNSNIPHKIVESAEKGCIIYYKKGKNHHVGYAISDKLFIHKTIKRVEIAPIPNEAIIYKVIYD